MSTPGANSTKDLQAERCKHVSKPRIQSALARLSACKPPNAAPYMSDTRFAPCLSPTSDARMSAASAMRVSDLSSTDMFSTLVLPNPR
eukprot:1525851-Amphidinium_carterae.4